MLLNESVRNRTAARLKALPKAVRLMVFTQEMECPHCRERRQLPEELASLAPHRIALEVYDLVTDSGMTREFGVDKIPTTCVVGDRDYGIGFCGAPTGFEFSSLVAAIELAAGSESHLKPETKARLASLTAPVDIRVFVTLTCPVCPLAASLAHRFAVESDQVTVGVIDSAECLQLSALHSITAVPRTLTNDRHAFEGALPGERFLEEVLKAVPSAPAH